MQAFLLLLAEWAVDKFGHEIFISIRDWLKGSVAEAKVQSALKDNQKDLANAVKSGDSNVIDKASENSLNNTRNP